MILPTSNRRAFTITEMLVVVGVMSVLMGLLLPALGGARRTARQHRELSAARQMMVAYINYANMNRDQVLPGFQYDLRAVNAEGRSIGSFAIPEAEARYPWRLAPYLDFNLQGLYVNDQERALEEMAQIDEWHYYYFTSLAPSLGLNATWVGGNKKELGFSPTALRNFGRFYVTSISEVYHPDRLIVFASARGVDPMGMLENNNVTEGYFEVRSPRLLAQDGERWTEEFVAGDDPGAFGFVSPRYGKAAVTAFVDAHVEAMGQRELRDMRYWANRAESFDYGLELKE
ncbi:MAG: type II secretion system protein [Planctomycetota bacterium]|jgi:prepilin-type N-terminal cleavage/methylation domain-containing protein